MSASTRWIVPAVAVTLCAVWLGSKAVPRGDGTNEAGFDVRGFAELPVVYQGRVKPYDTLARNSLVILSDRQYVRHEDGPRIEAADWLLDVISGSPRASTHPVFRIHNDQVRDVLDLDARRGYRYAWNEFEPRMPEVDRQITRIGEIDPAERDVYEQQLVEFYQRVNHYRILQESFALAAPGDGTVEAAMMRAKQLERFAQPFSVPPHGPDGEWRPLLATMVEGVMTGDLDPAARTLASMLSAWSMGDAATFNQQQESFRAFLADHPLPDAPPLVFETLFNHAAPFYHLAVVYVLAFLAGCIGLLGWGETLRRTVFWTLCLTLFVHTVAIGARVYISGYPPITNLYGTAIFIGWGCALLGLIIEAIHKLGVGNLLASTVGFLTLLIAHFLAGDGDTLQMMQAVLDTKFWLATHVVIINFGYAATFLAGGLAIIYLLRGVLTRTMSADVEKSFGRMIYGGLCFALLLSFVGTVLGGLWADDSWGRFWGWDPKENGALMIVLWNALILHARWGGMVKTRGVATLAIFGNVITAWSWFGVNQLGVGLHSYGFTDSVTFWLILFVLSQLGFMGLGMIPRRMWRSAPATQPRTPKAKAVETTGKDKGLPAAPEAG